MMGFGGAMRGMLGGNKDLSDFVGAALQTPEDKLIEQFKYREVLKMKDGKGKIDDYIETLQSQTVKKRYGKQERSVYPYTLAISYLLGYKANILRKLETKQNALIVDGKTQKSMNRFIRFAQEDKVALSPRPFTDLIRLYIDFMKSQITKETDFILLIPFLKKCIGILKGSRNINENTNILTYAHCEYMYCCIKSYSYQLAFPLVDQDIIQVQGDGSIDAQDYLGYFYYSALIQIGMNNYRSAMECLTMVCCPQTNDISAIQIDAYKKYILVSLIRKQHLVSLPRYTPRILTRYFPKFCGEYLELNSAFDSNANSEVIGIEKLRKIINKYVEVYTKDNNYGLVKKVMISCEKNSVKKLTSVYTKLSIQKVKSLCKFESEIKAKNLILSMIQNGDLAASLDSDDVVTFYDGTITESDQETLKRIQNGIIKTKDLFDGLDDKQLQIKQTKAFIEKSLNLPSSNVDSEAFLMNAMMSGGLRGAYGGM